MENKRLSRRILTRLEVNYRIVEEAELPKIKELINSSGAGRESIAIALSVKGLSGKMKEINPALLEILNQIDRKLDVLISNKKSIIKDAQKCYTYDISVGAVSLYGDIAIDKTVFASVNLMPGADIIYFIGKVTRRELLGDEHISVITFEFISEAAKQLIVSYMFSLERRSIRQSRK